jgi:hypothetical protein
VAEVLSTVVMSVYVAKGTAPLYTLIWRLILSYYTIAFGFIVFSRWVRQGIKDKLEDGLTADEKLAVSEKQ